MNLWFSLILSLISVFTDGNAGSQICLSTEEMELYQRVMDYRREQSLSVVPLSASLTLVAQAHAGDLEEHNPWQGHCNLHSWSDHGDWTSCCYTSDHREASCMWNKPRELTSYRGQGYEIAHFSSLGASALSAFEGWRDSKAHHAVIMNRQNWQGVEWKAIGIGIHGKFAVLWFGMEEDTAGHVSSCP